mmetsp:Transcript_11236/g.24110  ORF Transcript_11236/g.24110 Transcript_11236/m.24110 type:complete len:159 (+) Transcript_11236:1383-1859(+)
MRAARLPSIIMHDFSVYCLNFQGDAKSAAESACMHDAGIWLLYDITTYVRSFVYFVALPSVQMTGDDGMDRMTHPYVGLQILAASPDTPGTLRQLNNRPFESWRPILATAQYFEPHTPLSICSGRPVAATVCCGQVPELHPAIPQASREPAAVRAPRY